MNEKKLDVVAGIGAFLLLALIAALLMLLGYWILWHLWTWVIPQIWADGPASFTQPGFWPFAGMWLLMTIVLKAIRGK